MRKNLKKLMKKCLNKEKKSYIRYAGDNRRGMKSRNKRNEGQERG